MWSDSDTDSVSGETESDSDDDDDMVDEVVLPNTRVNDDSHTVVSRIMREIDGQDPIDSFTGPALDTPPPANEILLFTVEDPAGPADDDSNAGPADAIATDTGPATATTDAGPAPGVPDPSPLLKIGGK